MKKILPVLIVIVLCGFCAVAAHAKTKAVLRIVQSLTEPPTIDPHMHHDILVEDITRQVCEHLLERDPEGKLIPSLATSWNAVNDTTWQFKLRQGVKFQNHEPFNSRSVKFSLERIIDPNHKSPQKQFYETIDRIDAVDDYTVNIVTKKTDVLLPAKLSSFRGNILSMENLGASMDRPLSDFPVGTGPFKFHHWEKGNEIGLIANPNYWGGAPKIDEVIFKFIPNLDQQISMLKNGELDIVSNISPRSALDLKKNKETDILKKPTSQYISAQLNTQKGGPLSDKRVRQALNHAVDVNKLIKYVFNGNGRRIATLTMPEEFGFDPDLKPYPYDLEAARRLLKQAGVSNGFAMDFLVVNELDALGKAIVQELSKVNIRAKIRPISRKDFVSAVLDKTINFDMTLGNPTDPYFDASVQLDMMFSSKSPFSKFSSKELEDLLNQASITLSTEDRANLLRRVQEIIYEEAPKLFLFQSLKLYGIRNQVTQFVPYADGLLRINNVGVKR